MGLLDDLLNQVAGGKAQDADVHAAYDGVADALPSGALADGLAHAFNSDQTPPFEQMVSGLFVQSNPDQKAGMLSGGNVTPEQAQQVSPEAVEVLADHAAKKDPSIVDLAANFYAQHPALVKSIGVAALGLLMSRISASRRS